MTDADLYGHGVVYIPVTSEAMCDGLAPDDLAAYLNRTGDKMMRPWAYPDGTILPSLDLFPRATKAATAVAEARRRLSDAWSVLRYGYELDHEEH